MATLTNQQINLTYPGLIKLDDNAAIDPTILKQLTDGAGNNLPISVSQAQITFETGSTVDFTGVTVNGLPPSENTTYDLDTIFENDKINPRLFGSDGSTDQFYISAGSGITLADVGGGEFSISASGGSDPGLVSGGQTNSMKSASTLTAITAETKGEGDIVLGQNAAVENTAATDDRPYGGKSVVIGEDAKVLKTTDYSFVTEYFGGIAIGRGTEAKLTSNNDLPIAIGTYSEAIDGAIAIGGGTATNHTTANDKGIAIGWLAKETGGGSGVVIGAGANSSSYHGVAIGDGAQANGGSFGNSGIGMGYQARANTADSIVIANAVTISDAASTGCIAIGNDTSVGAVANAVALGQGVTANRADTVTVKELETETVGGGIVMYSPNGTGYKLTVSDAGAPVFTAI